MGLWWKVKGEGIERDAANDFETRFENRWKLSFHQPSSSFSSTQLPKSSNQTVHQEQVVNRNNPTETILHFFPKALQSRSSLEPLNRQLDNGSTVFRPSVVDLQVLKFARNGQCHESTEGMVRDYRREQGSLEVVNRRSIR